VSERESERERASERDRYLFSVVAHRSRRWETRVHEPNKCICMSLRMCKQLRFMLHTLAYTRLLTRLGTPGVFDSTLNHRHVISHTGESTNSFVPAEAPFSPFATSCVWWCAVSWCGSWKCFLLRAAAAPAAMTLILPLTDAVLKTTWVPLMINSNDAAKGERDFLVSPVGERCFYDP